MGAELENNEEVMNQVPCNSFENGFLESSESNAAETLSDENCPGLYGIPVSAPADFFS